MGYRDASESTVVTGARLIQTGYTDANGNLVSFTSGDNEVRKYWQASPAAVLYKKVVPPLLFLPGQTTSYLWDGSSLTSVSHSSLDTQIPGAVMFGGKYYVIDSANNVKVSDDLSSWTDTTEDASTIATDGTTLVLLYTSGTTIRYTTDGSSWNTYNSFSPGVIINAVRWAPIDEQWVAVGFWDDTLGSGYLLPFTATSTNLSSWTFNAMQAASPSTDISILDVSNTSVGLYKLWSYVGANNQYLNWFNCAIDGLNYDTPDGYGAANWGTGTTRGINDFIATPNGKMASPITQDNYIVNGVESYAIWQCFPGGQDRNGKSYTITWDNNDANSNFWLVDENDAQIVQIPTAVYAVGGCY